MTKPCAPSFARRATVKEPHQAYHSIQDDGTANTSAKRGLSEAKSPIRLSPADCGSLTNFNIPDAHNSNETSPNDDQDIKIKNRSEVGMEILLQPETRPISHEQLVVEVKGIYAGLKMVEDKCIDVDKKQLAAAQEQSSGKSKDLTTEQYNALIALHKTLLHEHYDFYISSSHPAASSELSSLALKYSIPSRLWRHGVYSFLEVLRHRLPASLEHLQAFIGIAFNTIMLLYENVKAFRYMWAEWLGDLGRYRMAIEEDNQDRKSWKNVSRYWYKKAVYRMPKIGRLPHRLAILAKPFTIRQLSLYSRALTCITPFDSTRDSMMKLLGPILDKQESVIRYIDLMELTFLHAHAILYTNGPMEEYRKLTDELTDGHLLPNFIAQIGPQGSNMLVDVAITNFASLQGYGLVKEGSPKSDQIMNEQEEQSDAEQVSQVSQLQDQTSALRIEDLGLSAEAIENAGLITFRMLSAVLRKPFRSCFAMIHVYAIFIRAASSIDTENSLIGKIIPWGDIVEFLNLTGLGFIWDERVHSPGFPGRKQGETPKPLPEDHTVRGLSWTASYFCEDWFGDSDADAENEEGILEDHYEARLIRILWLFIQVANLKKWIAFDHFRGKFVLTSVDYPGNSSEDEVGDSVRGLSEIGLTFDGSIDGSFDDRLDGSVSGPSEFVLTPNGSSSNSTEDGLDDSRGSFDHLLDDMFDDTRDHAVSFSTTPQMMLLKTLLTTYLSVRQLIHRMARVLATRETGWEAVSAERSVVAERGRSGALVRINPQGGSTHSEI